MPNLTVVIIPMLDDNFCYYVHPDGNKSNGFFVDVAQKAVAEAFVQEYGLESMTHILTTHHHWDHAGGNNDVKSTHGDIQIYGGQIDNVEGCTNPVNDGDSIDLFDG